MLVAFQLMGAEERAKAETNDRPIATYFNLLERFLDDQIRIADALSTIPPDQYQTWWANHSNEFCQISNFIGPLVFNEPARRDYDVRSLHAQLEHELAPHPSE